MIKLSRRHFIRAAVIASTSSCISSLSSCGPETAAVPLGEAFGKTVGEWLGLFAVNIVAETMFQQVSDWLQNGNDAFREAGRNAFEMMQSGGFGNIVNMPVFNAPNGVIFYGAIGNDGFNTCSPFIRQLAQEVVFYLLEGPGIIAIAQATAHIIAAKPENRTILSQAFVPSGEIQSNGWRFRFGEDGWAEYPTDLGSVQLRYKNTSRNNTGGTGHIAIKSVESHGGTLLDEVYALQYQAIG